VFASGVYYVFDDSCLPAQYLAAPIMQRIVADSQQQPAHGY